jgi:hypothetical protein
VFEADDDDFTPKMVECTGGSNACDTDAGRIRQYSDPAVATSIAAIHPNSDLPAGRVTRYGMYLYQNANRADLLDDATGNPNIGNWVDLTPSQSCGWACSNATPPIERRVVKVAVIDCGTGPHQQDITGSGEIHIQGKYLEVFLTESSTEPPDAAIYAEIVGDASGDSGGKQDEISNVRLVD